MFGLCQNKQGDQLPFCWLMVITTVAICAMSSYWVMAFLWTLVYKSKNVEEHPHLFTKLARDEISHSSSVSSLASSYLETHNSQKQVKSVAV